MQTGQSIALSKLEQIVQDGRVRAMGGLQKLSEEYGLRKDYMVKPSVIDFADSDALTPVVDGNPYSLTQHSRSQLLKRASVPVAYADTLEKHSRQDLLRFNLLSMLPTVSREGILFRTVRDTAKGILSSSYKRMDASPLFEEYAQMSLQMGMVPYRGDITETRAYLSFIRPEVIELMPGEYVVMGTEQRTSDYGRGAYGYCLSVLRLLCQNGMVGMDMLRAVHLGSRFDGARLNGTDSGVIQLSNETMDLDARTVRSALRDTIRGTNDQMKALETTLREKAGESVNLAAALDKLKKGGMKKETVEKVKTMYEADLPVEALPEAPGVWRLANVISLLANKAEGDEALDLQDTAMALMVPSQRKSQAA